MAGIYSRMVEMSRGRASYVILLDPDKASPSHLAEQAQAVSEYADLIFIGGSICVRQDFGAAVKSVKAASRVPVVIFPGDSTQVSPDADALLFLSLVSGRNPQLLVGEHVKAAPLMRRFGLEAIPVAYMLVESGETTSVQFMSQTLALPRTKPEIAMAHALAGEYLGLKLAYLDAGSGAREHVPAEMIEAVSGYVSLPVVVGGGIREPRQAGLVAAAGADFVVTGDAIEKTGSVQLVRELAEAVHSARSSPAEGAARERG
jgi:phosphoglycerol geranylgeranyltransferase